MANTINTLAAELGKLLATLRNVLQGTSRAKAFVNTLGWELPPGVEDIGLAGLDLTTFLGRLDIVLESSDEEWENELLMAARIADLTIATVDLVQNIDHLAQELPSKFAQYDDYFSRTDIHKELPRRAFDLLVTGYLSKKSPLLSAILHLLNIIEFKYFKADPE